MPPHLIVFHPRRRAESKLGERESERERVQ